MQRGYRQNPPGGSPPEHPRPKGHLRLAIIGIGAAALLLGIGRLICYGLDLVTVQRTEQELRDIYYQETTAPIETKSSTFALLSGTAETEPPESTALPQSSDRNPDTLASVPVDNSLLPAALTGASASLSASKSSPTPLPWLLNTAYPHNPRLQISSRFKSLQRESRYIIGWLTIPGLLDDAVVQQDNTYFLTHDAKGKENANGALFLDADIGLKSRPYTYLIYGHNMKSGAMFGSLRNYENVSFYHHAPVITFDTIYEEGKFIIFSAGSISTSSGRRNYLNFSALQSIEIAKREKAIEALIEASIYSAVINVEAEDQILLLVTCVDAEEERRIVAARRIRDEESEEDLIRQAQMSWKK